MDLCGSMFVLKKKTKKQHTTVCYVTREREVGGGGGREKETYLQLEEEKISPAQSRDRHAMEKEKKSPARSRDRHAMIKKDHLPGRATSPSRWVAQQPGLPAPGSRAVLNVEPIAISSISDDGVSCTCSLKDLCEKCPPVCGH